MCPYEVRIDRQYGGGLRTSRQYRDPDTANTVPVLWNEIAIGFTLALVLIGSVAKYHWSPLPERVE